MAVVKVQCPECRSHEVVKYGRQANDEQRYRCNNVACKRRIFLLQYHNTGRLPAVKRQIVEMALNGSGIRDTARVLQISPTTVIAVLKKSRRASCRHPLMASPPYSRAARTSVGRATELDERWSFVGATATARWLWYALDHHTGKVLAYVCGRRTDEVFLALRRVLEPFGSTRDYTDHWGAYERPLLPAGQCPGKRKTQQIERQHLTLRTRSKRLVRKTICFSKSTQLHDIVIGLFVNRYEFGIAV